MNSLERLRTDLATVLRNAGLRGVEQLQGRFTPPVFFIIPGSPYLVRGDTFGHFTYQFQVVLVSPARTAEFSTKQLDQMIADSGIAIHNSRFNLVQVSEPAGVTLAQGEYLAAILDVSVVDDLDNGRP